MGGAGGGATEDDRAAAGGEREGDACITAPALLERYDLSLREALPGSGRRAAGGKAGDAGGRADRDKAAQHGITHAETPVTRKTREAAGEGKKGAGRAAAQDDRAAARVE